MTDTEMIDSTSQRRIDDSELQDISRVFEDIRDTIGTFIVGNDRLVELVFISLLSEGHILIEGFPGTAKTTCAKIVSALADCEFKRMQCAVDIQPADIIGIHTWDQEKKEFRMRKGPIFSNIFLIDEINRLSPKSQSAFLEAMSECQATVDGIRFGITKPFFAIATQNPFEKESIFPLSESQRDRFMFSIQTQHLEGEDELELIRREHEGLLRAEKFIGALAPVLSRQTILQLIECAGKVHAEPHMQEYIRDIVMATRNHGDIYFGSSSRGSIALLRGAKACAALDNRSYIIPDDVQKIAPYAIQHRIILTREAEFSGVTISRVMQEIIESVEVP
ncbi:MAG: MoxR family ATPase [Methanomicrobiaceae archaeon]|nr:MoxR family ATPase [Methanomicrobiaceae archaeon]